MKIARLRNLDQRSLAHIIVLCGTFAGFAALTWNKWGDPFTDYGRNIMLAWMVARGKVLYRDIAHVYGPASTYFDAFLLATVECSRRVLAWKNLVLVALTCAALWRGVQLAFDRTTATAATIVFLCVFAFAHLSGMGIYNFICPYSPELVLGLQLCIGLVWLLLEFGGRLPRTCCIVAGLMAGVAFLTKPEPSLAAVLITAIGIAKIVADRKLRASHAVLLGLAGAIAPLIVTVICFSRHMPLAEAARATGAAWSFALNPRFIHDPVYVEMLGIDRASQRLSRFDNAVAYAVMVCGFLVVADRFAARRGLAVLSAAAGLALMPKLVFGPNLARLIPLVSTICLINSALGYIRGKRDHRTCWLLLWSVLSLIMIGRMFLNPDFDQYGFALAMPGAVLLVALALQVLPAAARTLGGSGMVVRVGMATLIAAFVTGTLLTSAKYYLGKTDVLGAGHDRMMVTANQYDPRLKILRQALTAIESTPATSTLLCLPEGELLNYLARREPAGKYAHFAAAELVSFGEQAMLEEMERQSPDYVVVIGRKLPWGRWGDDPGNGVKIMEWVNKNYHTLQVFGAEPYATGEFGIRLMSRR